ncbi:MAG: hypothetical protein EKK62_09660 [Acidimicrobiia bacterium]|nr:MAG: hypothetical protein EKK62_09660 [Acidimicrobiia bacterium]
MAKKNVSVPATTTPQVPAVPANVPTDWLLTKLEPGKPTPVAIAMQQGIRVIDLPRVKVPSGGSVAWTIPSLEGEEVSKEIVCVIATAQANQKAWWRNGLGSGNGASAPDCSSTDGVSGDGNNSMDGAAANNGTHLCRTCPWNQFGSARRDDGTPGAGKDCKDFTRLFLLRPNDMLPLVLALPPTSIKGLREFTLKLASRGLKFHQVAVRLTLESVKTPSPHSVVRFDFLGEITGKLAQITEGYGTQLDELLATTDSAAQGGELN